METLKKILKKEENKQLIEKMKSHSEDLWMHSIHVADMMEQVYPYVLKNELSIEEAVEGALFHDIGKLKIPVHILDKCGELSSREWQIMKKHPVYGAEMLKNKPLTVRNMALLHHEKPDKTGYPFGYSKEFIPIHCQILTALDIYEAMMSKRMYKEESNHDEAIRILRDIPLTTKDSPYQQTVSLLDNGIIKMRKLCDEILS